MTQVNLKSNAWELIGNQFWNIGRKSARPSTAETELLLNGIERGSKLAIIGASTKYVIEEAFSRGIEVTVFDFSRRMCVDLVESLPYLNENVHVLDITQPLPRVFAKSFDYVINDRLVNRFDLRESQLAITNMINLTSEGEVRASVKIGFYLIDEYLLKKGKEHNTLAEFYDPTTNSFDFSKAGKLLEPAIRTMPHGDIDINTLVEWYQKRGVEKRFSNQDVLSLIDAAGACSVSSIELPDAPNTRLYCFRGA